MNCANEQTLKSEEIVGDIAGLKCTGMMTVQPGLSIVIIFTTHKVNVTSSEYWDGERHDDKLELDEIEGRHCCLVEGSRGDDQERSYWPFVLRSSMPVKQSSELVHLMPFWCNTIFERVH